MFHGDFMGRNKNVIIPDKVYHKLWSYANDFDDFNKYFNEVYSVDSSKYVNMKKLNFSYEQVYDLLKTIFDCSKISINDIIKDNGFTKASFSHKYCIPIRTVENWCYEPKKCPAYTKLLILENLSYKLTPSFACREQNSLSKTNKTKNISLQAVSNKVVTENDTVSLDNDVQNFNLHNTNDFFSIKEYESSHLNSGNTSSVLSDYDWLSKENRSKRKNPRIDI